jgi:predicted enzyme related to lactoylglutathione lyase
MKRVTGIGGIFFRAKNIDEMRKWYEQHLGIQIEDYGGHTFRWRQKEQPERTGSTVWSPFPDDTTYFGDRKNTFMINYRVDNLDEVLEALKQEGVQVDDQIYEQEYGRFAWITDPEGNRIELWEPSGDN